MDPISLYGEVSLPNKGVLALPGQTYESAKMTKMVLQQNHIANHIVSEDAEYFNRLSHHLLVAYSMGAHSDLIKRIYDSHTANQALMPELLSESITEPKWTLYTGHLKAYASYLVFFNAFVNSHGAMETLDRFIFQNYTHWMFDFELIHSFTHIGYGIEFDINSLIVEGLALTASVINFPKDSVQQIHPLFDRISASLKFRNKLNFISVAKGIQRTNRQPRKGLSAFTIVDHVLYDRNLEPDLKGENHSDESWVLYRNNIVNGWCKLWIVDSASGWEEVVERSEELMWLATVLFTTASHLDDNLCQDFLMGRILASSIFLPSYVENVSHENSVKLLNYFFRMMMIQWVSKGRPRPRIKDILMTATDRPFNEKAESRSTGNPWTAIIQCASTHYDVHVAEILRMYVFCASTFGSATAGIFNSPLEGSELLDGSIFIRAAGVLLRSLGWGTDDPMNTTMEI